MPHFELTPVEARVLGCLLEKERLTPENYPISLRSLTAACNQSTNREPVTSYAEKAVDDALTALRGEKLAVLIREAGARVQKYRHNLPEHYELSSREIALLCVLLLRGPQTPGELRQRTERMHSFASLEEVDAALQELTRGTEPLARLLPARPGQKERRYVQLLSGEPSEETLAGPAPSADTGEPGVSRSARIEALEQEVAKLRGEIEGLGAQFEGFRKQFE